MILYSSTHKHGDFGGWLIQIYYWLYPELRKHQRFVEVPPSRGWRVPWDAECVDGLLIVWEPGCHGEDEDQQ